MRLNLIRIEYVNTAGAGNVSSVVLELDQREGVGGCGLQYVATLTQVTRDGRRVPTAGGGCPDLFFAQRKIEEWMDRFDRTPGLVKSPPVTPETLTRKDRS